MKELSNRELDALVAEKVFNIKVVKLNIVGEDISFIDKTKDELGIEAYRQIPCYSTDISAAWEITTKFDQVNVSTNSGAGAHCVVWIVGYTKDEDGVPDMFTYDACADTAPKAICLAALKAKGVDIDI